jgi:hypothetical protein
MLKLLLVLLVLLCRSAARGGVCVYMYVFGTAQYDAVRLAQPITMSCTNVLS